MSKPEPRVIPGDVVSDDQAESTSVEFTKEPAAALNGLKDGQRIVIRIPEGTTYLHRQIKINGSRAGQQMCVSESDWKALGKPGPGTGLEVRPSTVSDGRRNLTSMRALSVLVPVAIGALAIGPAALWPAPDSSSALSQQAVAQGVVSSLAGDPGKPGILEPLTNSLNVEPPEARGLNTVIRVGPGHLYVSAAAAQAFRQATKHQRNAAAAIGQRASAVLNSADKELVLSGNDVSRSRRQQRNHDHAVIGQAVIGVILGGVLVAPGLRRLYKYGSSA